MAALPSETDVVIVGAGTAGCVVAARLSEDPNLRVLVVEAGSTGRSPWIHIPVGFSRLLNDRRVDWCYQTTPQAGLANRVIPWPRGKVVGGSSAINGMVWVRGAPPDFDHWADLTGDRGWSWTATEPIFRQCESAPAEADQRLGRDGAVTLAFPRHRHPLARAFIEAGQHAGLARRRDLTISDRSGVGPYLTTIRRGRRVTAASAHLRPIQQRQNLVLATEAPVIRVEVTADRVAAGVVVRCGGEEQRVEARRGVILTTGAVATPQLLLLSGIGPGAHLAGHGIATKVAASEVGLNLQDHFGVRVIAEIATPITVNDDFRRPWRLVGHALRYATLRTGPLAMGGAYAGAFFATDGSARPDMQIHFLPLSSERRGWAFHAFSGVTANVCQLRPHSRGRVALDTSEPGAPPRIDPGYLADERDQQAIVAGIRFTRKLFEQPPWTTTYGAVVRVPEAGCDGDDELLDFARASGSTVFHPVGTCRMGRDEGAVVDPSFAVRGLRRLWIADASVMPTLPSGNTNAATTMVAERAARVLTRLLEPSVSTPP